MATHLQKHHRVLYFNPRSGSWSEQEVPDAKYRLSCSAAVEHYKVVENRLAIRNPRGGFDDLNPSEIERLPGDEQGFVFTVRPRQGKDRSFIEVRSARFIDDEFAENMLDGLSLHDLDLKPVADHRAIVDAFCLPAEEREVLYKRIQARGGQVEEAQADLNNMYESLKRLKEHRGELERMCAISRQVIDQMAEGIGTEAPSISKRCVAARLIREQANKLVQQIQDEQLALEKEAGMVQQKAWARACLKRAQEFSVEIEKLYKEHRSYETQAIIRTQETLEKSLPGAESPAATRRYMMIPLVEYYTDLGYDCRLTDDGMVLVLGDAIIELSDKPSVRTPDQQTIASSDMLLGRQTAERTQRKL